MKIVFLDTDTFGDAFDPNDFNNYGEVVNYPFTLPEETSSRIAFAEVIVTNKVRIDKGVLD